jgi:chaperonin cofactor prefoldin
MEEHKILRSKSTILNPSYHYEYAPQTPRYSYQRPQTNYQINLLEQRVHDLERDNKIIMSRLDQMYSENMSVVPQPVAYFGGKKTALLIGINYVGTPNQLRGCVPDVVNVGKMLVRRGYSKLTFLVDESIDTLQFGVDVISRNKPTKANMVKCIKDILRSSNAGDTVVIQYSGHGTSVPCYDGTEEDGKNEALCPLDMDRVGMLIDDELHDIMFNNIKDGVKLRCIFDACHSGTALDLPFTRDLSNSVGVNMNPKKDHNEDIVMLSGCKDNQTSADTKEGGALTTALLKNIDNINGKAVEYAVGILRNWLKSNRFEQVPCISYNKRDGVIFDI